jgi:Ca2+-binding RTX toxin-like protein
MPTVNLTYTPAANAFGTSTFDVAVQDSGGTANGGVDTSTTQTFTITVNSVNDQPSFSNITKTGNEDTDIAFAATDFTAAFSDIDGDSLSQIKITSLPDNGTLKLSGIDVTVNQEIATADVGNLTLTPNANFNGNTSFNWNGFDGTSYADADASVNMSISSLNDAPTLTPVTKTGNEDTDIAFADTDFTAAFSDIDGDSLSQIKITSLPDNGTLKLSGIDVTVNQEIATADVGNLTLTPNANFNGNTSFNWNGFDGTSYADADASVNMSISSLNDAPTLTPVTKTGNEDTDIAFADTDFTAAFSDIDGDSLSQIKITSLPTNGRLKLSGIDVTVNQEIATADLGNLTFTPNADFNGNTSFNWNGFDGISYADADASVNLSISSLNDAPTLTPVTKTGNEDTDIAFADTDFTAAFSDIDGDSLSQIKITSLPDNGTLKLSGIDVTVNQEIATTDVGNLTLTPDADFNGEIRFNWNGSDGQSYAANDGTFTLGIGSTNDAPTLTNVSKSGNKDNEILLSADDFIQAFSDVDLDSLFQVKITSLPEKGTLQLNGNPVTVNQEITTDQLNQLSFTPDAEFNGNTSFGWNGSDGTTYASASASVHLAIGSLKLIEPTFQTDVQENGGQNFYKVQLSSQPTANVVVDIRTDGETKLSTTDAPSTAQAVQLFFTPENWQISQTVKVVAVDDNVNEGLHSSEITHTITSQDLQYDKLTAIMTTSVSDNDRVTTNTSSNISSEDSANTSITNHSVNSSTSQDDRLNGDVELNIIHGREGNDYIDGQGGNDILYGRENDDYILGGDGDDKLFGGEDNDYLDGQAGADIMFAGSGRDRLLGGDGSDRLFGDSDNDYLQGGFGADTLTGGQGRDAFAIGLGTGGLTLEEADVITDFNVQEDLIDLINYATDGVLTPESLNITQGTGTYVNDAIVQHQATGEYLAILQGIEASEISLIQFI